MAVPRGQRPTAGERAAAAAALLCLAGAVVIAVLGIVTQLAAAALTIAAMAAGTTGSWYAVSRRGAARIAAMGVVTVALAAFATGLVFAGFAAWRVAAVLVLAAASAAMARHALRRTARALRSGHRWRAAPAPARPVLIVNPKSGGGKAERFRLAGECRRRGIEPILLRPGDDLRALAEEAAAGGADAIGMAGGDGSQALVAEVAARQGIPFVCVPAGTRNHFALDLGLDRRDVAGALEAFTGEAERRVDLAAVNGRVFVNNVSLGVYARVVGLPQYREARLRTAAAALPGLLGPDAAPPDLCYRGPDGRDYETADVILVSNNPYQLVHPGGWGSRERLDLGLLGIIAATIGGPAEARRFAALELAGQAGRFPGWLEWAAPRFAVTSREPVQAGVDGEAVELAPPLIFESRPGALRVWLPRRAVRPAPAARAVRLLSGSTAVDLARVAAGRGVSEPAAGPGSAGDPSRPAPPPRLPGR